MTRRTFTLRHAAVAALTSLSVVQTLTGAQVAAPATPPRAGREVVISAADCVAEKTGATVPAERIGAPVRQVTLTAPTWIAETATSPGYCRVEGAIAPVDTAPTARPINFAVALPARWNRRAAQLGGGGLNGTIPNLTGGGGPGSPSLIARGVATYGSDSGHQAAGFGGRRGAAPPAPPAAPAAPPAALRTTSDDWALNDEAIANLGHAQMKKT